MISSGVITITTDFGHKGPFAGVMKGVILSRFPQARVVDLAHDIPAPAPDMGSGQQSSVEQRFDSIVADHRGSLHLAEKTRPEYPAQSTAGMVRSQAEQKGGSDIMSPV